MHRIFWVLMPLLALPNLAQAQAASDRSPGSGTDLYKVNREVEAMQRDGRWDQLIAEGRANRLAFEAARQAESSAPPAVPGTLRPRRR
jgi:hypothetical protein